MSDFENFLCFSSATAQRCGTGTAEARDRINRENAEEKGREESVLSLLVFLLRNLRSFASAVPVPHRCAVAEEKQRKFSKSLYHLAIDERNEKRI